MRYITHISNLVLVQQDGGGNTAPKYRFGPQGDLTVGDASTNDAYVTGGADMIEADQAHPLCRVYPTDLLGATTISVEMCGLGNLVSQNAAGAALSSLQQGYRGIFFEAPWIDSPATSADIPAIANIYYKVQSGTVTYNSVSYVAGEEFVTDGTEVATTGTGVFALTIPPALKKAAATFRDELFKVKNLLDGNEALSYFLWGNGGFSGYQNIVSTAADYIGKVH